MDVAFARVGAECGRLEFGDWGKTYTNALRTSSRGSTPSFSSGKFSFLSENIWKTSLISFSSSAVMLFSFASFDARPRFGAGAELAAAPRRFGGCARVRLTLRNDFAQAYHSVHWGMLGLQRIRSFEVGRELCHSAKQQHFLSTISVLIYRISRPPR